MVGLVLFFRLEDEFEVERVVVAQGSDWGEGIVILMLTCFWSSSMVMDEFSKPIVPCSSSIQE